MKNSTIAQRLRIARTVAGYETAKSFIETNRERKISTNYMHYESGERHPSEKMMAHLAKVLNVDLHWLKTDEGSYFGGAKIPGGYVLRNGQMAVFSEVLTILLGHVISEETLLKAFEIFNTHIAHDLPREALLDVVRSSVEK
jgi:transcriptional regulator with XRE-family HTH domain